MIKLLFTLKFSRPKAVSTKVTKRMGSLSSLTFKYRWNQSTNWNGHTHSQKQHFKSLLKRQHNSNAMPNYIEKLLTQGFGERRRRRRKKYCFKNLTGFTQSLDFHRGPRDILQVPVWIYKEKSTEYEKGKDEIWAVWECISFQFYTDPRLPPADRLVRLATCDTTLLHAIHFPANIWAYLRRL